MISDSLPRCLTFKLMLISDGVITWLLEEYSDVHFLVIVGDGDIKFETIEVLNGIDSTSDFLKSAAIEVSGMELPTVGGGVLS